MTESLQFRHGKKECGADKTYYECSDFDFEYKGCCSHDPCIRPRGCWDDDSSDTRSWPASDMSDPESSASEPTDTESGINDKPTSSGSDIESTLVTRRRSTAHASMDDDNEDGSSPRGHSHSKTMKDSGTTHTIPNSIRVTVTKNTVIFTDRLPTSSTPVEPSTETPIDTIPTSSFPYTPSESPTETGISSPSTDDTNSGGPSIGLIVGGVIGGVASLALVVLVVIIFRRGKDTDQQLDVADMPYNNFDKKEEKGYLTRVLSRSTKNTTDPFAPFGGRIDRVDDPLHPPSGTFEMDATETVVHELPTAPFSDAKAKESQPGGHVAAGQAGYPVPTGPAASPEYPSATTYPVDPRSNLNATLEDRQQKQFVNHWNQYRALGEGPYQG
ncbi:fatty-acid amide hydrolase [Fusarium beomiforme]|uniref:Fatty-acid amide hydrolase n=1 Tax=Fusarium beomiforme TaxID=44412 RepID=A0A9P5AT45_9HYPO|nr:fatty-acid amide hydrolase [Fusarium beomiforme]